VIAWLALLLALAPARVDAQVPSVTVLHVAREGDTLLVHREDARRMELALERALGRCQRRSALPVGRHSVTVDVGADGRASSIVASDVPAAFSACLGAARVRGRPESRYTGAFAISVEPPPDELSASPPDVTGTGAASEPDRCTVRLAARGARTTVEVEVYEAGVTVAGAPTSDRVHAFWVTTERWGSATRFDEMTLARELADGTYVFTAELRFPNSGWPVAGWVSVDGGRTMAYCDSDGPPFDPTRLPMQP
jgi:hypothetical protein